MTKNQKIIIGLVLLGAGLYLFMQNKSKKIGDNTITESEKMRLFSEANPQYGVAPREDQYKRDMEKRRIALKEINRLGLQEEFKKYTDSAIPRS